MLPYPIHSITLTYYSNTGICIKGPGRQNSLIKVLVVSDNVPQVTWTMCLDLDLDLWGRFPKKGLGLLSGLYRTLYAIYLVPVALLAGKLR